MGFFSSALFVIFIVLWLLSYSGSPSVNPAATNIRRKLYLFGYGLIHMIFAKDTKQQATVDPDVIEGSVTDRRRVLLVRHAESKWNEIFNRGFGPSFFVRLGKALIQEFKFLVTEESIFFDSPINHEGAEQAKRLKSWIETNQAPELQEVLKILRGEGPPSILVCSNLRRCIETTTIGFWDRLARTNEKIKIHSYLQEISRNIDTLALASKGQVPALQEIKQEMGREFTNYDVKTNYGNKPLCGVGANRLDKFAEWIFLQKEEVIIVGGHSLWFREFFRKFLPHKVDHPSKNSKIKNCGIVSVELERGIHDKDIFYRINHKSIVEVHLGFEKPSKKKWVPKTKQH